MIGMPLAGLVATGACGSNGGDGSGGNIGGSSEDAGIPAVDRDGALELDASSDASPAPRDGATTSEGGGEGGPSGPSGPITVFVTNQVNSPQAGADVYFEDGVETKVTTDAQGIATATVHAGALVHVVITTSSAAAKRVDVTSIADVAPGDHIRVIGPEFTPVLPDYATVMGAIALPVGADQINTTINIYLPTACGASGGQTTNPDGSNRGYHYAVKKTCLDAAGQVTILFENEDNGSGSPWTFKTVTPDPMTPAIADIAVGDWSAADTVFFKATNNAPTGFTSVGRFDYSVRGAQVFSPRYNGNAKNGFYPSGSATISPDHISDTYAQSSVNNETSFSGHQLRQAFNDAPSEDLSLYLPRLSGAAVSGALSNPIATWQTGSALSGDFSGIAALRGYNPAVGDVYWTTVFHATAPTQTKFPSLPAAVAASSSSTGAWHLHEVSLYQSTQVTYATFHQNPSFQSQLPPLLAANGSTPSDLFYTLVQSQLY
jgi:hypothetical protein